MLYPVKFNPIFKEMIWGGQKILKKLNASVDSNKNIGEIFVVSGLEDDTSIIANGNLKGIALKDLIGKYKGDIVGKKVYKKFGTKFPLLIKFIDANRDLSIQVHPNDVLANKNHNAFGKTEMWYIIESEDNARLVSGFLKKTSAQEFEQKYHNKQLMDLMNSCPTQVGDIYYIPAGRVHSIGEGNLIAEVQQTSNITYRIYDYDRIDANGNKRELHHDLAMEAMNFSDDCAGKSSYQPIKNIPINVVNCPYFTTNVIELTHTLEKDYRLVDSFVILVNVGQGVCNISTSENELKLNELEAILIPACINHVSIIPKSEAKLLEVYIP